MNQSNHPFPLLNWVERPAFCVTDGCIAATNQAAEQFQLSVGTPVSTLLGEHLPAYQALTDGCLYLTLTINGIPCGASVQHMDGFDLFLIEQSNEQLRALALAAQHLRVPLSNVMVASDRLFAQLDQLESAVQVDHINQGLYQILRIIGNMSDADKYQASAPISMQTINFTAIADEVMEKAQTMTEGTGVTIAYTGLNEPVLGLANSEQIQRAFYNLLSNAIKFTAAGQTVTVKLGKVNHQLSFIVSNPSAAESSGDLFACYRRTAGLGNSNTGVGLGLTLVKAAATAHGGTLLMDRPDEKHIRFTMTVAIRKEASSGNVHTPMVRIGDYAGGRDMGLLELSEVLEHSHYHKIN